MAEEPTFDETTRKMANEYNENHKQEFRDVWEEIKTFRNRPPVWASVVITVLMGLLGIFGTIVATCNK